MSRKAISVSHSSFIFEFKSFSYLLLVNLSTSLGYTMFQIAFIWLVHEISRTAFEAGLLIFASTVPYIFFGLLGGVYSDIRNRRHILIWTNLFTIISSGVLVYIVHVGRLTSWLLAIIIFIIVSLRCFSSPANRALISNTLPEEHWQAGNSLFLIMWQFSRSVSPIIAGFLIARFSSEIVFQLFMVSAIFSFILSTFIQVSTIEKTADNNVSIIKDLKDTFVFLQTVKPLLWTIVFFGVTLLFETGINRLGLTSMSDQIWRLDSRGYGIIISVFGIGNIIGSIVLSRKKISQYTKFIYFGWIFWGVSFGLIGFSKVFYVAALLAFIAGFAESLSDVPSVSMIQRLVPDRMIGKVFSIWSTVAFIGESGSSLLAGILLETLGIQYAFMTTALVMAFIGAISLFKYGTSATVNER